MARVTKPETIPLPLASGEKLVVKKRLNTGERRDMLAMMRGPDGRMDGLKSGQATIIAFVFDWDLKDDATGQPLPFKGLTNEEKASVLDSLDPLDFKEIEEACEAHEDRMLAERRAEKKIQIEKQKEGQRSSSAEGSGSESTK